MTQLQAMFLGFGRSVVASRLIAELRSHGVAARRIAAAADLPAQPSCSRLLVFVDCRNDEHKALQALAFARQQYGQVVMIAVVRQSNFCQYYRLMDAGAQGYFSAADHPALIASSARRLAQA